MFRHHGGAADASFFRSVRIVGDGCQIGKSQTADIPNQTLVLWLSPMFLATMFHHRAEAPPHVRFNPDLLYDLITSSVNHEPDRAASVFPF